MPGSKDFEVGMAAVLHEQCGATDGAAESLYLRVDKGRLVAAGQVGCEGVINLGARAEERLGEG